ncbi:MAG: helicase-related protein, partial [Myxococcota bacterium]
ARARAGQGSDRVVIFTESLVTQAWLRERLISSGVVTDDEVTLLSGTNDSPRAKAALERWRAEVPHEGEPPSTEVAIRLALVHEFKTRSRVFISTEAGAKGLNLQFCNTVVNYDLPWNPQRIEQRIGRCHRYGQQHDVTVINFLAKDNETQRLTFDILSQKLELFGTVLDASDAVLHRSSGATGEVLASALGAEFEGELRRIYERARTLDEVQAELRALRDRVEDERRRFEETSARTASVLAERFDEEVQRVFRRHVSQLPRALEELDGQLLRVVGAHLDARGSRWRSRRSESGVVVEFDGETHGPLHLAHPLVQDAVRSARETPVPGIVVKAPRNVPPGRGRLSLVKLSVDGFERVEQLLPVLELADGTVVDDAAAVLRSPLEEGAPGPSREGGSEAIELAVFLAQAELDAAEHHRFERAALQAERFIEDRLLVLRKRRALVAERFDLATQRRDGATSSDLREDAERARAELQRQLDALDDEVSRLAVRDDERFAQHRAHINARRYGPPRVEVLFSVEVELR